jgi:phosphoribosyl-ATP pyrophosphohydrolase/phosphoribosyl-AMP cyclohydrolase
MADSAFIEQLERLIRDRLRAAPETSYTARLAEKGIVAVAQKVGEEGVELALAAAAQGDTEVIEESADLLFHMLVLLALRGIPFASIVQTLEERHRERAAK